MSMYNHVLMAVDFHGDNEEIIAKGEELAKANDAVLFLVHVNEPLTVAYAADGMTWSEQVVGLEASLRKESRKKMAELAKSLKVDDDHCFVREGKPSSEIHEIVEEHDIDVIVMGTHGKSGLQLLLGSTANSVLHGAPCDVLAVRITDKS